MLNFFRKKKNDSEFVWGCSYSVFDGEELLEASIKSIRNVMDYINVVYQKSNWYNTEHNEKLYLFCKSLQEQGLIDELIEYVPDSKIPAPEQEKNKRMLGLEYAQRYGVNYFMTMDVDEFYEENDILKAKQFIIDNKITHSYCLQYKYAYSPTNRRTDFVGYVGFFCRIDKKSKICKNSHIPVLIDPTRRISHKRGAKYFVIPNLKMHHFEWCRKNIQKKIASSSYEKNNWHFPPKTEGVFAPDGIIKVENIFNIRVD